MIIQTPEPLKQTIEDYDFWFANGLVHAISINRDAGDRIDFDTHPMACMIHLEAKPHPADPDRLTTPEDITIFMGHVIKITKTTKDVIAITQEQKIEFRRTIQEMSKTIQ